MSEAAAIMGREGARSLGTHYFAAVREKRGLSIEKVSSETHIRVQRLREIERDDFSQLCASELCPHVRHRLCQIPWHSDFESPALASRRGRVQARMAINIFRRTACDYMRTDCPSSGGAGGSAKACHGRPHASVGFGGFKLWTTIRDIERLGLNRMAQEDKAALTVPSIQNSGPPTSVTPDSSAANSASTGRGDRSSRRPKCRSARPRQPADRRRFWSAPIWTRAIAFGNLLMSMVPGEGRPPKVGMISLGCAKNLVDAEIMLGDAAARWL